MVDTEKQDLVKVDILTRLAERTWIPIEIIWSYMPDLPSTSCCSMVSKSWRDIFGPKVNKLKAEDKAEFHELIAGWRTQKAWAPVEEIQMYKNDKAWVHHDLLFWRYKKRAPREWEEWDYQCGGGCRKLENEGLDEVGKETLFFAHLEIGRMRLKECVGQVVAKPYVVDLPSGVAQVKEVLVSCRFHYGELNSRLFLLMDSEGTFVMGNIWTGVTQKVLDKVPDAITAVFDDKFLMLVTATRVKLFRLDWSQDEAALVKLELVDETSDDGINGSRLVEKVGKRLMFSQASGKLSEVTFAGGKIRKVWELAVPIQAHHRLTHVCLVDQTLVVLARCSRSSGGQELFAFDASDVESPPKEVKRILSEVTWRFKIQRFGSHGVAFVEEILPNNVCVLTLEELIGFDCSRGSFMMTIEACSVHRLWLEVCARTVGCFGCRADVVLVKENWLEHSKGFDDDCYSAFCIPEYYEGEEEEEEEEEAVPDG